MGLRKAIAKRLSPRAYLRWLAKRRTDLTVHADPFAGMRYAEASYGSAYIPKLAGCYERELYPTIEGVVSGGYDRLVDVGAAEGYFSVGLAMRCEAPVIAFEMSAKGRELATTIARRNGVEERIDLRGECDGAALEQALEGATKAFCLMDIEGAEAELLDPEKAPSLMRTTILVEVHEFARPGITAQLMRRFDDSHEIEFVWGQERRGEDFPFESFWTRRLPERYLRRAVDESRPTTQSWLLMRPRAFARDAAA